MTEGTTPEAPETDEPGEGEVTTPEDNDNGDEPISVEAARKLRSEAKTLRERAKTAEARADELAQRLHTALVEQDGRLHDPRDLPYRPENVEDPDALTAAIDALLEDRPHMRARKTAGDIGQGVRGEPTAPVDFSALFR